MLKFFYDLNPFTSHAPETSDRAAPTAEDQHHHPQATTNSGPRIWTFEPVDEHCTQSARPPSSEAIRPRSSNAFGTASLAGNNTLNEGYRSGDHASFAPLPPPRAPTATTYSSLPQDRQTMLHGGGSDAFRTAIHPAKPGNSNSFRPVNTIDQRKPDRANVSKSVSARNVSSPSMPRRPQADYGRKRTSIGFGQLAFLNMYSEVASPVGPGVSTPHRGSSSDSNKRRKTMHGSSPAHEVVDLSGEDKEDDCIQVQPSHLARETHHSHHFSRPTSSKSQRSIDGSNTSQSKRYAGPFNEFSSTDGIIARRRKGKPGKVDTFANRTPQFERAHSRSGTHLGVPITVDEDGPDEQTRPPYHNLSEKIAAAQQIPSHELTTLDEDELHISNPSSIPTVMPPRTATSSRINPSTEPRWHQNGDLQRATITDHRKLRDQFNRNGNEQLKIDEIEDDELAGVSNIGHYRGHGRPSFARAAPVNTASKRSKLVTSDSWPLAYARSYHLEVRGPNLALRKQQRNGVFESYEIIRATGDDSSSEVIRVIDKEKINQVVADHDSRVRITGPAAHDIGCKYWYDLQFQHTKGIKSFRNEVIRLTIKIYDKEPDDMEALFNKPFTPNMKIGTEAPLADPEHALLEQRVQNGMEKKDQRPPRRGLLINNLDRSVGEVPRISKPSNGQPRTRTVTQPAGSLQARPKRTTRASQPVYLETGSNTAPPALEEPSKFSVEFGLGDPWNRPVQFGAGRRRALVNFEDLLRLDEGEYLNDALVDFYIIYLLEQANIPLNKVYFFNTHFFNSLTRIPEGQKGSINYDAVARWTAREDIFKYDYIVVPICETTHWYLAIICNVSNISRKPILAESDQSSPATKPRLEPTVETEFVSTEDKPDAGLGSLPTRNETIAAVIDQGASEDLNLFDEAHRNTYNGTQTEPIASVSVQESSPANTTQMQRLSIDDATPKGILGDASSSSRSSKTKDKRRPGPIMKKYDADAPIIIVLDSLGLSHPKTVRALKDYVFEEGSAKRGMEANITQNVFYVREAHIPMQDNYTDCGLYLLAYVQKFLEDPRGFVTKILTREMDRETDWPDMSAPLIRKNMRDILQNLSKQQEGEHRKEKKVKHTPPAIAAPPVEAPKPALMSLNASKPETGNKVPLSHAVAQASADPPVLLDKVPRKGSPMVVVGVKTPGSVPSKPSTQSPAKSQERGHESTAQARTLPVTKLFEHSIQPSVPDVSWSQGSKSPLKLLFPHVPFQEQPAADNESSNSPKRRQAQEEIELASPKRRKLEEYPEASTPKRPSPEYSTRSGTKIRLPNQPGSAQAKQDFTRASRSGVGAETPYTSQFTAHAQHGASLDPFAADDNASRLFPKAVRVRRSSSSAPTAGQDRFSSISPKPAHPTRGSSADPITIEDSQDTVQYAHSPATSRSQQNTQRTPRKHVPKPSTGRTPQMTKRPHIMDELEERLSKEGTPPLQQQHSPLRTLSQPRESIEHEEEWSGFQDDDGGATVPETPPEQERVKDLWSEGDPLPH